MQRENGKGPLGQDLAAGELVTQAARRFQKEDTLARIVDHAKKPIHDYIPGAQITASYDPQRFGYNLKVEARAIDEDTGIIKTFAMTQSVDDWALARIAGDTETQQKMFWAQTGVRIAEQMAKTMESEGFSPTTRRTSFKLPDDYFRSPYEEKWSRDRISSISRSTIQASQSLDEMRKKMESLGKKVSVYESRMDENMYEQAIESIKRSAARRGE